MSDMYVPVLMELDSYWQKAVEDAICDTLKGEKRLHCALRNRKKINQKLEKLGLKHVYSQIRFSNVPPAGPESAEEEQEISESGSEHSRSSGNGSKAIEPAKSRSRSKNHGEPPFEKHKNPERPLLGNGSLEKMKKSQSSFNCEPMGVENVNEELFESEKEKDLNCVTSNLYGVTSNMSFQDDGDKIQWLHLRDESDFEESDADSSEEAEEDDFHTRPASKSKNYIINKNPDLRLPQKTKKSKNSKIQKKFDAQEGLFLKKELQNLMRQSPCPEQRLALALAKREILKKKSSSIGSSNASIELKHSVAKMLEKRKKSKKHSSPFIKFYLEVDRELCHKYPMEEITEEATRRWRDVDEAQKSDYGKTKHK